MTVDTNVLAVRSREELLRRNEIFDAFFKSEAPATRRSLPRCPAVSSPEDVSWLSAMARPRQDAQHVSVEFVHPVIVGKRALPALDLGPEFERLPVILHPQDMVMGFAFPERDEAVERALGAAREAWGSHLRAGGRGWRLSLRSPGRGPLRARRSSRFSTTCSGRRCTCTSSTASRARRGSVSLPLPVPGKRGAEARRGRKEAGLDAAEDGGGQRHARCRRRDGGGSYLGDLRRRRWAAASGARSSPSATAARPRTRTTWSPTA